MSSDSGCWGIRGSGFMAKRLASDWRPAFFNFTTCDKCKKRTEQISDGKKDGYRYCLEHGGTP